MKMEKHLRMKPFGVAPLGETLSVPQLPVNIMGHNNLSKADENSVQNNTVRSFTLLVGGFFGNYTDSVCTSLKMHTVR